MTIPVLPESAPFTHAQRGWLNGFFAGVFGLDQSNKNGSGSNGIHSSAPHHSTLTNGHPVAAPVVKEEAFPWHDPSLPIEDRLKLAEDKPPERMLMAAMAQLDCGSCGYVCQTYAEAIARGEDNDLTKCGPGGKDTARKLKELVAKKTALPTLSPNGHTERNGQAKHESTNGTVHGVHPSAAPAGTQASTRPHDRKNPFPASLIKCVPLTQPGSEKDVRLVAYNLRGSGLTYEVGDAVGVYPENCPELVERVLAVLGARGDELVPTSDNRTIYSYEALLRDRTITKVNESTVMLLARCAADPSEARTLQALADNDRDAILDSSDLLDLLEQFPSARPPITALIAALSPLQPRLYSISSSLKANPDEVHLTVGVVRYKRGTRVRKGVASTYMSDILSPRQKARLFIHPSHGFRLPASGDTPVIMVGPGTGIAPFRAFLEERQATGARGKNWLFFGDQRRDFDFLYQKEIEGYVQRGVLRRLDTAFSRDQAEKVYVQHRMKENAAELWAWLQEGAHFYVCGDAQRMAADVDQALLQIVVEHGAMSKAAAREYILQLTRDKRYQRDVY